VAIQVESASVDSASMTQGLIETEGIGSRSYTDGFDAPLTISESSPRRASRRQLIRRALVAADVVGLVAAYVALVLLQGSGMTLDLLFLIAIVPLWVIGANAYGLYDRDEQRPDHTTLDDAGPIFTLIAIGTWLGLVVSSSTSIVDVTTDTALAFSSAAFATIMTSRSVARVAMRGRPSYRQNTIIVGAGDVGQLVGRKILQHPEFGIRLIGFVDSEPKEMRSDLAEIPLLGHLSEIVSLVRRYDAGRVIVAFSNDTHDQLVELVRSLRALDVQIDLVPRLFEAVGPAVGMHSVEGLPLVGLHGSHTSRPVRAIKRGIDVVGATAMLVIASPLFVFAAWRIRRDSPGPVFFRQERLGMQMKSFTVLKFRTMKVDTDPAPHREFIEAIMDPGATPSSENANLYKLNRQDAVTGAGAWLRRTSLDELPQLINVIRGEMSLVGPRPCLSYEIGLFEPHHFDRFLVPAGMTGLWQVAARAHATFKEALDLDAAYARNWSLGLDLRLLARTPWVMLRGSETR